MKSLRGSLRITQRTCAVPLCGIMLCFSIVIMLNFTGVVYAVTTAQESNAVEVSLTHGVVNNKTVYSIIIDSSHIPLEAKDSYGFLAVIIPNTSYGNIVLLKKMFRLGSRFNVPLKAVWLSFGRVLVSVWSPDINLSLVKLFTVKYPPLRVDYIYVNLVDADGDGLYDSVESDLGVDVNGSAFEGFENVSVLMLGTGVFEVSSYRLNESLKPGFNLLRVKAPIPVIKAGESLHVFVNLTFGNGSLTVADCTFGNKSLYNAESRVPLAVAFFSVGNLTKAVAEPGSSVYLGYLPLGNYVGRLKIKNLGLSIPYLNLTEAVVVNGSSHIVLRRSLPTIHTGASAEVNLTFPVVSDGFVEVNVTYGRFLITSFYVVYRVLNLSCMDVDMNNVKVINNDVSLMLSLSNACGVTLRGYVNVSVNGKYVVRYFVLSPYSGRRTYVILSSVPVRGSKLRVNASVTLSTSVGVVHAVSKSVILKHVITKQSTSSASALKVASGTVPAVITAAVIAAVLAFLLYRFKTRR